VDPRQAAPQDGKVRPAPTKPSYLNDNAALQCGNLLFMRN